MFSLFCPFVVLIVYHLGFKGGNFVLIGPVPDHCFPFTYMLSVYLLLIYTQTKLYTLKRSYKWPFFKLIFFRLSGKKIEMNFLPKFVHFNRRKFIGALVKVYSA